MDGKEITQLIAFSGFFLFIALPLLSGSMWLLNSPSATTGDAISLLESAVIPWWTGLAQAAPLLFVVIVGILVWAGADEVLG